MHNDSSTKLKVDEQKQQNIFAANVKPLGTSCQKIL